MVCEHTLTDRRDQRMSFIGEVDDRKRTGDKERFICHGGVQNRPRKSLSVLESAQLVSRRSLITFRTRRTGS